MVRQARQRCDSGVYHVVLRGINRGDIFFDDDDSLHFLETLAQKNRNQEYGVYGYCLMNNHVHLENEDTVSRTMSRIGTSYAKWYNQKYSRSGHVFFYAKSNLTGFVVGSYNVTKQLKSNTSKNLSFQIGARCDS